MNWPVSLEDAAAWATIIGTIIVVTGAILGWLGKWSFRLPAGLVSLEARTLFVLSVAVVAIPIIAWGPKWGFVPALANLLILPSVPAYLDKWLRRPLNRRTVSVPRALVYILAILLCLMNVGALLSMVPWPGLPDMSSLWERPPEIGSSEVRYRIQSAESCTELDKEFQLALSNFRRAEARSDRERLIEEREYMVLAERRMRDKSCANTPEVPALPSSDTVAPSTPTTRR